MNNLQIFSNEQFGQVRTLDVNGKTYFVGKDIAEILGYVNPTKAISTHCKGVSKMGIPSNGGIQQMNVITEGDIYRLTAKSELPGAEKFESWIFDEVLPSIRRTGSYNPTKRTRVDEILEIIKTLPTDKYKNKAVSALIRLIPIEQKKSLSKIPYLDLEAILEDFLINDDVILKRTENGLAVDKRKLYEFFEKYGLKYTDTLRALDDANLIYHTPHCRTVQIRVEEVKNPVRVVIIKEWKYCG